MKMKKLKTTVMGLVLLTIATTQAATIDIGSFGAGSFAVDAGSGIFPTQSASGLTTNLTLAAGDIWYGAFATAKNWSAYTDLGLYMSVASQAASTPFTFSLFDSNNNLIQSFTGATAVSASPVFVALTPVSSGVTYSDVLSVAFSWDGPGAINTTLNSVQANVNLAAVPEPSVASLFALGTVGLVALRARRKS